jgi:diaminopimelate epimerase
MIDVIKAHAYGNDFLLVEERALGRLDPVRTARDLCDRHAGIGADGLIIFRREAGGAAMRLLNADGSRAEVSGNGVRCLAAWLVEQAPGASRSTIDVVTEAGTKRLVPLGREDGRHLFRAAMGQPEDLAERTLQVGTETLRAVTLRVGNPQCVVLGEASETMLARYGRAVSTHAAFPEGTNVEFAELDAPDRVRIVIWERGVGPTLASGTGACAAAVAAAAFGGARRDVRVESPGGTQRVEWQPDGLYLTGWAEIVLEGRWLRAT